MPSGEEEEIAAPGRLPAFFNAGATRAFLVFLGSSSMLEPEPLRKVSAHAGNDPSRAKCRLESTAEPVKCVRGKHEADSTPPSVRCCTNDRARSLRRHAAELSGFSIVLDSGGTGSLNRWTASYAFALR